MQAVVITLMRMLTLETNTVYCCIVPIIRLLRQATIESGRGLQKLKAWLKRIQVLCHITL